MIVENIAIEEDKNVNRIDDDENRRRSSKPKIQLNNGGSSNSL